MTSQRFFSPYTLPVHIDSYDYRIICLFIGCAIYACFGSPTPDSFTLVEVVIALFLALSIGVGRVRDALLQPINRIKERKRFWKSAGQALLIYGLTIPVLIGIVSSHSFQDAWRDIFPFLFLFLPLFSLQVIRARPYYFRSLLFLVCLIGFVFSVRSIAIRYGLGCTDWCSDELLYLENMPTVLFSCLIMIGTAMHFAARSFTVKSCIIAYCLLGVSMFPLVAMILTLQRASVGAVALYSFLIFCHHFYKSPKRGIGVLFVLSFALFVVSMYFGGIFSSLWLKTQKVGLNMRPQEFAAVWQVVIASPLTFLFGAGWGSYFSSPAVGGLSVSFTHNFFSSIIFKTGIVGGILSLLYIGGLLERLVRVILIAPTLGFAILLPIAIDLSLYASFKSLDFGLMLLLVSGSLVYLRQSNFSPVRVDA